MTLLERRLNKMTLGEFLEITEDVDINSTLEINDAGRWATVTDVEIDGNQIIISFEE